MNRLKSLFASIALLLGGMYAHAQTINLQYTSSPTVCFNTGFITVNASGGTGPYTYRIDSGTYYPNIIYPITLASHQDTFYDMPQGVFDVEVMDANNDSASFPVYVGGNYQFPIMNISPQANGVSCTGLLGLPPYHYAISSVNSYSGFGPYQLSDTFMLCPGTYWIRLMDSCGNIYTDSIDFQYAVPLGGYVNCVNFASGNLDLVASGGHPPYTFSAGSQTNHTGIFHGLSSYAIYSAYVTDSCGSVYRYLVSDPPVYLLETCPFDSNYYYDPTSFYNHSFMGDSLTFTCTNCSPFQSRTFMGSYFDTVFRNIVPGISYDFIITEPKGSCGVDTPTYQITIEEPIFTVNYISCKSFSASINLPVDSYVVYSINRVVIASNQTGFFFNMPDSAYEIEAYINSTCTDSAGSYLQIPHFAFPNCFTEMRDSICNLGWFLNVYPPVNETYFLTDTSGDTIRANPVDTFYDLMPSYPYTMVSDSGCHINLVTPSTSIYADVFSSLNCSSAQSQIGFYLTTQYICPSYYFLKLYHGQTTVYDAAIPATSNEIGPVTVADTGWYTYDLYLNNMTDSPYATYDTTCLIAMGQVFVSGITIPYPFPSFGYVCAPYSTDLIYYNIYGGSPPYTVEVQGYGTDTIYGNNAVFPTYHTGTYNMIVYDDCGISRSIAFNVIDTCSCNLFAYITANDPLNCAGDTVELQSYIPPASIFNWYVNGQLYSVSPDTVYTPLTSGFDSIKFVFTAYPGCSDSAFTNLYTDTVPFFDLGQDTTYCGPFSLILQAGNFNTVWSTGATSPAIFVNAPGTYTATSTNQCGSHTGSITISQVIPPYLGDDTTYCGAFSVTLTTGISGTHWSTGAVGPSLTVSTPGTYYASLDDQSCSVIDSIHLFDIPGAFSYDTAYCDTFSRVLHSGSSSAVWSTGTTGDSVTVSAPGTYMAAITDQCGTQTDTFIIVQNQITGLSLSASDNSVLVCYFQPDSVVFMAVVDSSSGVPATFTWPEGQTFPMVYSSRLVADSGGIYYVTATRGACTVVSASDTVHPIYCDTPCVYLTAIPDAFTPNGDNKNELYTIPYSCMPASFSITILDRWGQTVYQSADITRGWDGTYRGVPQPQGSYLVFVCVAEEPSRVNYCRTAAVNLIR